MAVPNTLHIIVTSFENCSHTMEKSLDRKSTRLNSSHTVISYAVFCLKKKIVQNRQPLFCKEFETLPEFGLRQTAERERPRDILQRTRVMVVAHCLNNLRRGTRCVKTS